jgi:hypothetical protein
VLVHEREVRRNECYRIYDNTLFYLGIWRSIRMVAAGIGMCLSMSFDDDPMVQFIRLDQFRRNLMWVKLDTLGLKNLQPLRDEITEKMNEIKQRIEP